MRVNSADQAWAALAEQVQVVRPEAETREAFIAECRSGRLDGIVALYRAAITVAGKFDAELVAALPESLKYVCYTGAWFQVFCPIEASDSERR